MTDANLKCSKRKIRWEILVLLIVSLILILPPIINQYPYPNNSDDTPKYLQIINNVVSGDLHDKDTYRYIGYNLSRNIESYRYAAPAVIGLVVKVLHTDPYWSFYIYHYLALVLIALSVLLFYKKVFNKMTGCIGLILVMFCTPSILWFFYNGEIFNLMNLLVFGLMGSLALIYWLRTKRLYYAFVSIILFAISVLFHSVTGLEIVACVGFFLLAYLVYKLLKREWKEVKSAGIYTLVFGFVCGGLMLLLSPEAWGILKGVFVSNLGMSIEPSNWNTVPFGWFLYSYINIMVLIIACMSGIYIIRHKHILSETSRIGFCLFLSFIFVLGISVLLRSGEPRRSAMDLSIFVSMLNSGIIGVSLSNLKERFDIKRASVNIRYSSIYSIMLSILCLLMIVSVSVSTLDVWFSYHCAIRQVDQKAISFINGLDGDSYSVSTQIQPKIYDIFIKDKNYFVNGGDYIIYRDSPMTGETDPDERWTQVIGNVSKESDYYGLQMLDEFNDGNVRIVVYANKPASEVLY